MNADDHGMPRIERKSQAIAILKNALSANIRAYPRSSAFKKQAHDWMRAK
jgi:hypothetical protein